MRALTIAFYAMAAPFLLRAPIHGTRETKSHPGAANSSLHQTFSPPQFRDACQSWMYNDSLIGHIELFRRAPSPNGFFFLIGRLLLCCGGVVLLTKWKSASCFDWKRERGSKVERARAM